ncbi:MAG: galactose oxidase-like domain-containing protein [Haloarculaceae archaeon]
MADAEDAHDGRGGEEPATGRGADDPSRVGEWEPVEHRFEALPVHTALLHTGKVLAFAGSGNDETRLDDPYPAELFDPEAGTVETVDQNLDGDVFCAGHAHLSDGRLLVAGGTDSYDGNIKLPGLPALPLFGGLDQAYLFDPEDEAWTRVEDMDAGRWYPTLVTMGDGSVLCAAGLTESFPWVTLRKIERYEPGQGWEPVDGAGRWLPLYPRLHLLPDGTVFYAGSYNTHYTFPFSLKGFPTAVLDPETGEWTDYELPNEAQREEGASMLLPLRPDDDYRPRVVLTGGGTPAGSKAMADTEVIDLGAADPTWRSVEEMHHARYYTYAVLLPTGEVFVAGGRSGETGHVDHDFDEQKGALPSIPGAVHEAELFDPETETWRRLDSMAVDRLYHSGALLLPDGRVLMSGSNPKRRVDELRIETYRPPYLFQGPRPDVEGAPDAVTYGERFDVETPQAPDIDEVVLVRQATATHCLTTDQRLVELPVADREADALTATVPDEPDLLPPGYYMLFVLEDGVPSESPFVRVHHGDA